MSITSLIFKKGNYIGNIELDVIIREGATSSSTVTRNPVESGADMNDHIRMEPMTYYMQGVISDSGISIIDQFTSVASRLPGAKTRSQQGWEDLLELQVSKIPFDLIQNLKTYKNIVIESLSEDQDKSTSNALFFNASLVELILPGARALDEESYDEQNVEDSMSTKVNGGLKQLGE